ncbi:MAG: hypothetical protein O7E52_25905 [Candidatus Poribacteria bacterium]|nr:hypothetical protein [Candidatus Poribacteria bacterium]
MRQLLPRLYHWQAFNPDIKHHVDSYYVRLEPPVLIDPMLPDEGINWFDPHGAPAHIYMTNRLHDRHCQHYIDRYGATVWCHRAGLHEFANGSLTVTPFEHGDALPGGVTAVEVGVLCPEETALLIPAAEGVLAIGDALIRWNGEIGFVPDALLGDNPPAIRAGIRDAFMRICETFEFDHLIFAHGAPIVGGGKAALQRYLETVTG